MRGPHSSDQLLPPNSDRDILFMLLGTEDLPVHSDLIGQVAHNIIFSTTNCPRRDRAPSCLLTIELRWSRREYLLLLPARRSSVMRRFLSVLTSTDARSGTVGRNYRQYPAVLRDRHTSPPPEKAHATHVPASSSAIFNLIKIQPYLKTYFDPMLNQIAVLLISSFLDRGFQSIINFG